MRDAGRIPRRGTWPFVAVLLVASSATAVTAGLAGAPATAQFPTFGPVIDEAPSQTAVAGAGVVRAASVVAPSIGVRHMAPPGAVPAAAVGPAFDAGPTPFRPARLVLPGKVSAPVSAVGLHDDDSLVVPDDPRVVGWWTGGSMAGEAFGSVVVVGHVDSATRGLGVLAALPGLGPGQVVELTAGARVARYRVVSARLVPQARLSRASALFRTDGAAQLVLITCGGAFDAAHHRYVDNYVVVARAVP
jgi:hypothetical protein